VEVAEEETRNTGEDAGANCATRVRATNSQCVELLGEKTLQGWRNRSTTAQKRIRLHTVSRGAGSSVVMKEMSPEERKK